MKKLLIATDSFLPRWDGVARFLSEVIPKLSKKYMITVLAPEFPGPPVEYDGVKIIRFKTFNFQVNAYTPAKPNLKLVKQQVKEADIESLKADYLYAIIQAEEAYCRFYSFLRVGFGFQGNGEQARDKKG